MKFNLDDQLMTQDLNGKSIHVPVPMSHIGKCPLNARLIAPFRYFHLIVVAVVDIILMLQLMLMLFLMLLLLLIDADEDVSGVSIRLLHYFGCRTKMMDNL